MEIVNVIYKDGEITINFDEDSSVGIEKVYLDTVNNRDNIFSEEEDDHEYIITSFKCEETSIIIDVSEYYNTLFIVSVVTEGGNMLQSIAIDTDTIYREKVMLFTSYCSTCLDKHQKDVILMCLFHSLLLEYAVKKNLLTNAIDHFVDLSRLLGLSEKHTCGKHFKGRKPNKKVKHKCNCCNGCCLL